MRLYLPFLLYFPAESNKCRYVLKNRGAIYFSSLERINFFSERFVCMFTTISFLYMIFFYCELYFYIVNNKIKFSTQVQTAVHCWEGSKIAMTSPNAKWQFSSVGNKILFTKKNIWRVTFHREYFKLWFCGLVTWSPAIFRWLVLLMWQTNKLEHEYQKLNLRYEKKLAYEPNCLLKRSLRIISVFLNLFLVVSLSAPK